MSVVVSRLSQRTDLFEAARSALSEYVLLPEPWQAFGLASSDAEAFLQSELRDFPGSATPPRGEVLVVTTVAELVGLGEVVPFDVQTCEFRRVYVRSEHQGTGIGRTLVASMLDEARALGYTTTVLDVLPIREQARAFWASMGFTARDPFRDSLFPMLYLHRSLTTDAAVEDPTIHR